MNAVQQYMAEMRDTILLQKFSMEERQAALEDIGQRCELIKSEKALQQLAIAVNRDTVQLLAAIAKLFDRLAEKFGESEENSDRKGF